MKKINSLAKSIGAQAIIPNGQRDELIFSGKKILVLFNIRPLLTYNIIHVALFCAIKRLIDLNYNCTVLLYDMTVLWGEMSDSIASDNDANRAIDNFYERLTSFCGKGKVEIITESILWKIKNFENDYLQKMLKLVHHCANIDISDKSYSANTGYFFDVMLSIIYESIVRPDFVITARSEMQTIWKDVRARQNLSKVFGKGYLPPVALCIQDLKKYNKDELITSMDSDDPFVQDINDDRLRKMVGEINSYYKKSVEDLYKIYNGGEDHDKDLNEIIIIFREHLYGN